MTDQISWRIAPAPYADVQMLADQLGVSEVLAQILVRRGFTGAEEARAFLHPDFRVHDPYAMTGMAAARERIDRALQRDEPIAVYGDYDADGITATFLLRRVLEEHGADVRSRLPNRFTDGYGLSLAAVEELAAAGVRLLITVDCGITARDEVLRARELGMDVIVTDHHEMEGALPDCVVLTPKLGGYPCPHLAGVGVAFKLAHALLVEKPEAPLVEVPLALRALTDVVAIGTIADMVPLVGENRVLATIGLGRLRSAPRPGLAALMEVADVKPGAVTAGAVGFRLAPRINAAGRLDDASLALELLDCAERPEALSLALRLNELNRERQAIEAAILAEACAMVSEPAPAALVLSSPQWHEGVIGIVASRVAERFGRPTIMLSEGDEEAKGSGRSIAAFDILGAVEASSEHLLAFGGHRAACGLRLRREHIPGFRAAFVARVAATISGDLAPTHRIDAIVGGHQLTLALADELELLAPHGFGNHGVTLLLRGAQIQAPRLTRNGRHMQYRVHCHGASCQAIHFNFSALDQVGATGLHDVALVLSKNEYNGAVSAQAEVKELSRRREPAVDLCRTACDANCTDRACGAAFWRLVLDGLPCRGPGASAAPSVPPVPGAERIVDRRGRPLAPAVSALAAGGERVLVLVADVARRRPLLSRDVLGEDIAARGLYVQDACASRVALAADADVVVAGMDLVAVIDAGRLASVVSGFPHVVLADPPFTRGLFAHVVANCASSWLHLCWGRAELDFAGRMRQAEYDVDAAARRIWRALEAGSGRFDESLAGELLSRQTFLPSVATLAAAFRVLREAGLLQVDGDAYELQRPATKIDITTTESHKAWHTLFQTDDFLPTCLTARL
ncbi:MAG TPA: single-stranded-DNA-specific exonuclease RecJ [Thermoleophilia bacterium]|nr:single-stranded-DNA-specific exonuclease RecJ [Thermoleophilia bacterium]